MKSLSASRESENKKTFLGTVMGAMPLVVVGYSGIDDFDISRWITQRPFGPEEQELPPTRELVWVQYVHRGKVDDKTSGVDFPYVVRGSDIPADPYIIMESGLQNLITHWSKKGWLEHLTVVLHDLPAHLLVDLASEVRCDAHRRHNPLPIKFRKLTDWDK